MTSSSISSIISNDIYKTAWTRPTAAGVSGLSLARERGWLLAWDAKQWLYLLDHKGNANAQRQLPELSSADAADDGTAYAAAGKQGKVWWLAPDLMTRWEKQLKHRPLAVALDPHGRYLAVSDQRGHVYFFDGQGQEVRRMQSPRPLRHIAFVPAAPFLVGSADYGLVMAFDLKGEILWRDGLVANVGGLSVDGNGEQILVACFSEGLHRYDDKGKNLSRLTTKDACRCVAQTFVGSWILTSGLTHRLYVLDQKGQVVTKMKMDKPAVALAFGALGREIFAALDNGPILKLTRTKT